LCAPKPQSFEFGLMLPYTGRFAALGTAITQGFNIALDENGGKLGGRDVEFFTV
jgi:branched-chain amino acid transport system substrate-binding protein